MHSVLIACPRTLELVPTGFEAEGEDDLQAENILYDCPSCSGDHPWTPADAILADGVGA